MTDKKIEVEDTRIEDTRIEDLARHGSRPVWEEGGATYGKPGKSSSSRADLRLH